MVIVGFSNGQSVMPEVYQMCEDIQEQNEKSTSSVRLSNKLLEIHYKILENVKDNMAPFIENLLKATDQKKINWWFCFFNIHDIRKT